ncbi:phage tail spike protein [Gardnerella pickettii]|uniref:phage tail spike protein n=1 Tax=Gardnerella pickettii TaxID=2914924 RepID=UPI0039EE4DA9
MSRSRGRRFNYQDWQARKAEKQKQWEQRQAEKAKRQAEWAARKAARKAEYEARRKAQLELAAARKAEREKRRAERAKEIARKRAEIAQRKRERLERQKRELERLSNKSETFTKRVSFTAINDGKPYLVDEDARLLYGIRDAAGDIQHAEGEVIFNDATNPQELLRLGKQKLKEVSKPQVSYEAEVVNLGRAGFDPDGVNIGDAVQIIDTTFTPSIRVEGRVLKIEEDLLDSVDATRITLGNIHESYTQKRRAQEQKLDALIAQSDEWNAVAEGNGLYVSDLIGRVNDILNARGGYTYLTPNTGLLVYDKNKDKNPTTVTQIGGGFWRIADSKKSNGDWDWKNVCDGHGLFANRIYTGILCDAQGRNFWNLDTGEFSLQASVKIGGKTISEITNESLTQDAIFNKLTNNGETQGIYLSGGHVYLNATYMQTGSLSADLIKTGTLDANLIRAGRIQDYANSNWWDLSASTIHVSRGEIGGMTITDNAIYNGALKLNSRGMYFTDDYGGALGHIGWRRDYSGARMLAFEADSYDTCLGWWSDGRLRLLLDNNADDDGGGGRSAGFTMFGNLSLTNRSLTHAVIDSSCCVSGGGLNMAVQQFYLPKAIYNGQVTDYQPVRFGFGHGFVIDDNWR